MLPSWVRVVCVDINPAVVTKLSDRGSMTFDGWNAAQAYTEMKQFRFEGFPDHPVLRNYVYAYRPVAPKQPAVLATGIITTK